MVSMVDDGNHLIEFEPYANKKLSVYIPYWLRMLCFLENGVFFPHYIPEISSSNPYNES